MIDIIFLVAIILGYFLQTTRKVKSFLTGESSSTEKWVVEADDGSVYTYNNGIKRYFRRGEPVYRCSNAEIYCFRVSSYSRSNAVQSIWLESRQQIVPENVLKALFIVSRQVPHLQFCFMKRGSKLWLKRIEKFKIDFKISTKDPLEMHKEMLDTMFDLWNGPLWKVRLIQNVTDNKFESKKYSAFLSFGIHHSITDATSNMKICRDLISILNKMSAGEPISPIFSPICPTMDVVTEDIQSRLYYVTSVCWRFYCLVTRNTGSQSYYHDLLPIPKSKSTDPQIVFHNFTKEETDMMLKFCKKAKITVNSFMITVANFALLSVGQSRSAKPIGPRKITAVQAINMRRHYEPQYIDSSGCQISALEEDFELSLSDAKDFWTIAKQVHTRIKTKNEVSKDPAKNILLMSFNFNIVLINYFLASTRLKGRSFCHYFATNMGNLKDLLPGPKEDDDIEITNVLRGTGGPYNGAPMVISFHTFRDRMLISIDYSKRGMAVETAHAFLDYWIQHIKNFTKELTIS